jgi:type IV pilus assembly protein PilY1
MRTQVDFCRQPRSGSLMLALGAGLLSQVAFAAAPGTVDLLATPPEITASVAPNVALTFDDSGSMAWQYMPDRPAYQTGSSWGISSTPSTNTSYPWFCAGRIDANVTDPTNPRSKPMNGMFYDPNVTYRPPLKADGITEFPQATFTAARNNGIAHFRPNSPVNQGTTNLSTASFCSSSVNEDAAYFRIDSDDFTQDWTNRNMIVAADDWANVPFMTGYRGDRSISGVGMNPATLLDFGSTAQRVTPDFADGLTATGGIYEMEEGAQINDDPTIALVADGTYDTPNILLRINTRRCTDVQVSWRLRDLNPDNTSAIQPVSVQARVGTSGNFTSLYSIDNANTGGDNPGSITLAASYAGQERVQIRWITANAVGDDNMIGIDDIVVSGTCTPDPDGAAYYRLKDSVTLEQDSFGRITTPSNVIYDRTNWERVSLPASQRQNFANWFSYYRNRTTAAASAMSRAFAPFDANIRVVWQNLGNNRNTAGVDAPILTNQPIYKFEDDPLNTNVRTRFYDWLFQIPASGGTPNVAASVRVGEYFKRAGGAVDSNPYWDRNYSDSTESRELSCRQNFHINMSDGFWNGGNPHVGGAVADRRYVGTSLSAPNALPDGRAYNTADQQTKFFNRFTGTAVTPTLTDVMFHYWATDLRPDFTAADATRLKVPPFIPDRSTGLFGVPIAAGQDPRDNLEVYWNPANDPATWAHLVNFNISFGMSGTLPNTPEVLRELRLGTSSTFIWPYPVVGTDDARKLDDFWHAALASRGRFLSAQNPEQLISALQEIIASIIARRGASTAVSVSLPIITDGTTGYTAGYDTTDWSGFVTRNRLDPNTAERIGVLWDAGCILTGGSCSTTATTGLPVRDPDTRAILTSTGTPGTGRPFRWSSLTSRQRERLSVDPSTIRLDLGTWTADAFGQQRLEYVRGSRVNETTASPRFRQRSSVLGAVIRGQPIYVSSPTAGYPDNFPVGSPERNAYDNGDSYAQFQVDKRERAPTVYVAANDGMLHAFDGGTGHERFAYVPNAVIENFRLTRSTQFEGGFTPSVDDRPLVTDVFINAKWRTVLLGSLRLGGRGVYLLDINEPPISTTVTESALAAVPLWEYTNAAPEGDSTGDCAVGGRHCSSLGYTYESINIARLNYDHKWVALVSSGYFPIDGTDPASNSPKANQTSLLVIDLATGTLIREIVTSSAPQTADRSFGLSQPIVMDTGTDFIDDVAFAGDLAGNLWRFDLSSDDPADWKVDLMFTTYGAGGGATPGTAGVAGERPISSAPLVMSDSTGREPIIIVGSGKFIGLPDRVASIPQQSFYGVEDLGTCGSDPASIACTSYPIRPNRLIVRKIDQAGNAVRTIRDGSIETLPANPLGWRIRLDIPSEAGERSFDSGFPFYTSNQVLLRSIIPKGVDPCDPGARYGLMVVSAATGLAYVDPTDETPSRTVGGVVASSTPPGEPITLRGGGNVVIAGLTERDGSGGVVNQAVINAITQSLSRADDIWHRGAWRDILQQ